MPETANPIIVMQTSLGTIEIELDAPRAPISTRNFLQYVNEGFYDGTVFHRVIKNFMIQGGGHAADMRRKSVHAPIKNESSNGLSNARGTIAMARTNDPNSATSQFFINVVDNKGLDPGPGNPGYAVFGKVISGMDVVDKIRNTPTGRINSPVAGPMQDVPTQTVAIETARAK